MTLDILCPGSTATVVTIDTPDALRERLRDFGMIPGSHVRICYRSPQGKVTALEIMGAVIATRTVYLKNIQVNQL